MVTPEAPQSRNLYRRFMAEIRYDKGWVTGPVYMLTAHVPMLAGMMGVGIFGVKSIGELTQDRPLLLAKALSALTPSGLIEGISAVREIAATGNLEQAGLYALGVLGSAAAIGVGGYFANQAELGLEDARKADEEERFRRHSPSYRY